MVSLREKEPRLDHTEGVLEADQKQGESQQHTRKQRPERWGWSHREKVRREAALVGG